MARGARWAALIASLNLAGAVLLTTPAATAAPPVAVRSALHTGATDASSGSAAAEACAADTEPNDHEADIQPITVPGCVSGTLPQDDQDMYLWEVPAGPPVRWTITLTGVGGTVTAVKFLAITSDPGVTPIVAGSQIYEVDSSPLDVGATVASDVLFAPGRYLVGLTRSATADGGVPPAFDYSFSIQPGTPLPPARDHEPNDDRQHAAAVSGSFEASGDLKGSDDFLAWSLSAEDAATRWQLSVQTQLGSYAVVVLSKPSGQELARTYLDPDGRATLHDLALSAGKYVLDVGNATADSVPWIVTAVPETETFADPEPNNDPSTAVPLDPANLVATGRLSQSIDVDDYLLHVDDQLASLLLDIKLIWRQGPNRQLCLIDKQTSEQLLCRSQDGGDAMANLFLPVGDYILEIRGDPDPMIPYVLRVEPTQAPAPDFETEPNDTPPTASTWTAGIVMRGREGPGDVDYFKLQVSGAPQLWELDATGDHINAIAWYRQDGTDLANGDLSLDGTSATLQDMYLVPGDHWVRVDATGSYSLSLKPLGPPDPNGEREPNNDSTNAQPLELGVPRTGRLVQNNDLDVSRFSLGAAERLHLTIEPPSDGSVYWRIYQDGVTQMAGDNTDQPGGVVDAEVSLPAGDYELWLEPGTASRGHYRFELDREDPWAPTTTLPATVSVATPTQTVAAYWQAGQHVDGQVTLTNTSAAPETLDLDVATSHYAWTASLGQEQVSLAAGASTTVPLSIDVQPDAWADVPVRISVRARAASGAQAVGHVELTPGRLVPPVSPRTIWSVPPALLGGLDVAATGLGGQPIPTFDPTAEAQLYDGITPAGNGFFGSFTELPVTLTSDLAGDAPVPVAGMILNPQARNADISYLPKDVELWLSTDGANWTKALSGQLSPLPIDQSFVLPSPVMASFAQLRITSMWADGSTNVVLGEFKVIAAPDATRDEINVADPAIGGHLVYMDPQGPSEDVPYSLLNEDTGLNWLFVKGGTRPSWVLAFQDDRAAQLTRLEWVDPQGSDRNARSTSVQVAVSLDSPLGPWTDVGNWQLKRAADGSVAPFAFAQPTWARYVRFVADAKKDDGNREQPGVLRAIETGTGADYRSVAGEYGATSSGDYEIQKPPPVDAPTYAPDGNDTPESASALAPDTSTSSTAHTGDDVDWYGVDIPDGQNTVSFTVHGAPSVGVSLTLQDAGGGSVPMTFKPGDDPGSVVYSATVQPGHYQLEVQQPPFSTVFTYDTSGSMGNYLSFVFEAIRSFAADVQPGRQAVQIVPFEEDPLLPEWSDDQYALQDASEGALTAGGGSSSAETAVLDATERLSTREGAKAILLVTDAETSSFDKATELWQRFRDLRPQVFAVQVGADSTLARSGHYMQDWAVSSAGFYQYTHTHADMDRAFDRMATWLERPTEYTLSYAATFVEPPKPSNKPGTLEVVGANQGDPSKVPVASNIAIELILDTSGSMLDRFEGKRRIDVAQTVLTHLVEDKLPAGVPLAMRIFGDTPSSCDTKLAVPLGPMQPTEVVSQINKVHILTSVNTPIGAALKQVASDLATVTGPRIVVLMTDGEENCGGNPAAAVRLLAKAGVDVHVNIVGFQIGQKSLRGQMAAWAKLGHGSFFNATTGSDLNAALALAVSAPYRVLDENGKVVATGTVNGTPVALKPGSYHVVVLTDPQVEFDAQVEAGQPLVLTLPSG